MITFGAKYLSRVNIGEFKNNKEVVPYKAAIVEFDPNDMRDSFSLNFISCFSLRRTGYSNSLYGDFLNTTEKDIMNKRQSRFFAVTKEQASYKYVKSRNILGLAEISSKSSCPNEIYLNYLQTIKNWFSQKYCYVGTSTLNFLKEIYPNKDITLKSLSSAVNFYKKNGFTASYKNENGLIEMRYRTVNQTPNSV